MIKEKWGFPKIKRIKLLKLERFFTFDPVIFQETCVQKR